MWYLLSIVCTDRQYLTYRNDKLKDGRTFESYGIEKGAMILLSQIGATFPINIKFPTGEMARILVEGTNTIVNPKSRFHAWVQRDKGTEFWILKMERR